MINGYVSIQCWDIEVHNPIDSRTITLRITGGGNGFPSGGVTGNGEDGGGTVGGGGGTTGGNGGTTDPNCRTCSSCTIPPDQPDCPELSDYDTCHQQGFPSWVCCQENGSGGCTEDEIEQRWENENIDYSTLPDCLQQLVRNFINVDGSDIGSIVRQFDEDGLLGDNFNLIFQAGEVSDDRDTETTTNEFWNEYFITINLNNSANTTNLGFYQTIVHEAVHAIMFFRLFTESAYFSANYSDDYSSLTFNDVFNMYADEFPDDTYDSNSGLNQHEFMANHMVSLMANSIQQMDDYTESREYYWQLAWGGLTETDVYDGFYQAYLNDNNFSISGFEFEINHAMLYGIQTAIQNEDQHNQNSKGDKVLDENGSCE